MLRLGEEAASLLVQGDYRGLADRFGYALAFGKDPAEAIRADVEACLSEGGQTSALATPAQSKIRIKHFSASDLPLFALVECKLELADGSGSTLIELIGTEKGNERHMTLEQISRF